MSDGIAFCLKCKKKTKMVNIQNVTMKNGRKAQKAKCSVCGGGVYKILPGTGVSKSKKSKSTKSKSKKSKKGGKSRSKKSKKTTKSRRKSKKA
jgi:hypothetical protein